KIKTTNFRRSTGGDNSIGDVHVKERTPGRVRSCDGSALHRGGELPRLAFGRSVTAIGEHSENLFKV
ncbi:unnamed protein product, partial [Ectocarpus fasciculatus]